MPTPAGKVAGQVLRGLSGRNTGVAV